MTKLGLSPVETPPAATICDRTWCFSIPKDIEPGEAPLE